MELGGGVAPARVIVDEEKEPTVAAGRRWEEGSEDLGVNEATAVRR
jgi:hypothetical protein